MVVVTSALAQDFLHRPDIVALLQEPGCEAVPQRMTTD
jgi:hypothetical protein